MKFIGREEELNILEKELNARKFSCVLLYGRRRVGKTELIHQCLNNRKEKVLFFTALKVNYNDNLEMFCQYISDQYNLSYQMNDLNSIFDFIAEKSKKEKTILVIDEYSYFRGVDSIVDSYVQRFVDTNTNNKNLKVILSGSLIDIMKGIVESGEPLYGRFTSVLELKPFDYYETGKFFSNRSNEDKLKLYAIFGGIPHYLRLVDPSKSVEENIIDLFFSKNIVMESEVEILLNGELAKVELANSVLNYLGKGNKSYQDINQKLSSRKASNNAAYVLNKLSAIDIVDKEIDVNHIDSRKGLYYIKDNALLFYYSYIMPNKNKLSVISGEAFYKNYVKEDLENTYYPKQFEKICKEFLIRKNREGQMKIPFDAIGKLTYHDKVTHTNSEFDIVTNDKNGYEYYECKYHKHKIQQKDIDEEIRQAESTGLNFYRYGFFSNSGFGKNVKQDQYDLYDLKDLYG